MRFNKGDNIYLLYYIDTHIHVCDMEVLRALLAFIDPSSKYEHDRKKEKKLHSLLAT
jgi:hypothetical protein